MPVFSAADLHLIAKALRHERSGRIYAAHRKGHLVKGGVLAQLDRLEATFTALACARDDEDAARRGSSNRAHSPP